MNKPRKREVRRVSDNELRSHALNVRVSSDEHAMFKAAAFARDMTISDYCRHLAEKDVKLMLHSGRMKHDEEGWKVKIEDQWGEVEP